MYVPFRRADVEEPLIGALGLTLPGPLLASTHPRLARTDLSAPLFHALLPLYAAFLLPSFHHLWLVSGTGNANFFYAATLVWAIGMGGWAVEAIKAKGKREMLMLQGVEGRKQWREGKWKVLQR